MTKKRKTFRTTTYIVLGLLSFGEELSGYDIRQWAQNLRFFYWSPAQSQVYAELQKLEEWKCVSARTVEQEGKPNKRLYRITQTGIEKFQRWMRSEEMDTTTVIKHSVALKLFFGHMSTPEVLRNMLEQFIEETRAMMGQLNVVQETMEDDPAFEYSALVTAWGYRYYEAEIAIAQKMLERLEIRNGEAT